MSVNLKKSRNKYLELEYPGRSMGGGYPGRRRIDKRDVNVVE